VKSENETSNSKATDSPQSGVRTLEKVAAVDSDHAAVGVVLLEPQSGYHAPWSLRWLFPSPWSFRRLFPSLSPKRLIEEGPMRYQNAPLIRRSKNIVLLDRTAKVLRMERIKIRPWMDPTTGTVLHKWNALVSPTPHAEKGRRCCLHCAPWKGYLRKLCVPRKPLLPCCAFSLLAANHFLSSLFAPTISTKTRFRSKQLD
jgi:hypothetical protein